MKRPLGSSPRTASSSYHQGGIGRYIHHEAFRGNPHHHVRSRGRRRREGGGGLPSAAATTGGGGRRIPTSHHHPHRLRIGGYRYVGR